MRSINDYSEYLAALKDKSSKDPVICAEAKKALGKLKQEDPGRYTLYRMLNKEIEAPKEEIPKKERKVYDKEKFIREHPEIDVRDLRKKAKERLKKGSYGFGLRFDLPTWLTEENLLNSVDQLTLIDLITANGRPIPRQTLLRKCIKIAVIENRIDEVLLQNIIVDATFCYYKPVLNQIPKEIRGYAKKAFCSACREVISAKGVQSFVRGDGTIYFYKVLRSISKKGNEELFEMLSTAQDVERLIEAERNGKKSNVNQ